MERIEISRFPRQWFLVWGWLGGRQALGRLQGCSSELLREIGGLRDTVEILHNVRRSQPLGGLSCSVPVDWMWFNLHVTADLPPTPDNKTLIIRCPECEGIFSYWLYAGVRYSYCGQLEGRAWFQSERRALDSDSDD